MRDDDVDGGVVVVGKHISRGNQVSQSVVYVRQLTTSTAGEPS